MQMVFTWSNLLVWFVAGFQAEIPLLDESRGFCVCSLLPNCLWRLLGSFKQAVKCPQNNILFLLLSELAISGGQLCRWVFHCSFSPFCLLRLFNSCNIHTTAAVVVNCWVNCWLFCLVFNIKQYLACVYTLITTMAYHTPQSSTIIQNIMPHMPCSILCNPHILTGKRSNILSGFQQC